MKIREIAKGVGRSEGPVLRPDGELVFVSMDQGLIYAIKDGRTRVLADVGFDPNGATEGLDGTIYVTQRGGIRSGPNRGTGGVHAIGLDGTVRWLTRDPISPNDLCFGPDGLLYITDPTRPREVRDDTRLFRCDVATGEAEILFSVPWNANGIGFGPDDALYVANFGDHKIMRYPLEGSRIGKGEVFIRMPAGCPDGFLFDVDGNLTVCGVSITDVPGQIQTYDRNGKLIDTFLPGPHQLYTNIALSPDRVLYITDTNGGTVLAVDEWPTAGILLYPFRRASGKT